jgi:hypothetical protein
MKKNVRPAAPLDPVRLLTQMASTMSISESPSMLVNSPANNSGNPRCRNASFMR